MEKKTTTRKTAAKATEAPVNDKPTYEQLENYAKQLSIQSQRMARELNECHMLLDSKRLDYLFKVIENPLSFNTEFVNTCASEIETALTTVGEEEETEE